ncbi:MAG: sulfotransferase [Novosphingobium sp.]|nr:sulfotransferase [Novosphingobium sp.]
MAILTPHEAKARAIEATGFDDFGAPGFEEGLERSLDAFNRLPLKPEALEAAMAKIVHDLSNRLRIEQWYKDHPETEDEVIEGPVLVCGLPRTGTTATVGMMATDPRYRFLRMWEATNPVPPPRLEDEATDPRAEAARKVARDMASMQSQHIMDPDGPEEDLVMLAPLDMHSYHGAYPMPDDYIEWWASSDFTTTYAYHRRVLKLLQSHRPPHLWLIKAPVHLFKLEAFAGEYPDAKYVWTHRDPADVIPSVSSLQYTLAEQRCVEGSQDKRAFGSKFLEFWADGMERALKARQAIGEGRFIDVWNRDVVADPIGTFEGLYDSLGFEMTLQVRAGLADYNRRNARGAHGEHRYTAEEYGLDKGDIRSAFRTYVERFNL